jgi:hypothetical protein
VNQSPISSDALEHINTTIYSRKTDLSIDRPMSTTMSVRLQRGSIAGASSGSQDPHGLMMNNFSLESTLMFRVFESLSSNLFGGYGAARDQIALGNKPLTAGEIYQHRWQLAMRYSFWAHRNGLHVLFDLQELFQFQIWQLR